MIFISAYCSDAGIVKEVNQDALCIKSTVNSCGSVMMAVVCDGMGGLQEGEYASSFTVNRFSDWFDCEENRLLQMPLCREVINRAWKSLVKGINEELLAYANPKGIQLGTTLSAILLTIDSYYIIQVGDSRIYRIYRQLEQLTEDQSLVAREVAMGKLTKEEARTDKRRNILLQCIGARESVTPTVCSGINYPDSLYLLCSDGFVHELGEGEYVSMLHPESITDSRDLTERLESLVETAKQRKEKDNITVCSIVVKEEQ